MWLLKWDREVHRTTDSLRLVMVDPEKKKPVVIPLSYRAPQGIAPAYFPLESPEIEPLSFTPTPQGLFFTPRNENYYAPVLFHIPWQQIDDWIGRNDPPPSSH